MHTMLNGLPSHTVRHGLTGTMHHRYSPCKHCDDLDKTSWDCLKKKLSASSVVTVFDHWKRNVHRTLKTNRSSHWTEQTGKLVKTIRFDSAFLFLVWQCPPLGQGWSQPTVSHMEQRNKRCFEETEFLRFHIKGLLSPFRTNGSPS